MGTVAVAVAALIAVLGARVPSSSSQRIPSGMGPFRIELRSLNACAASERCLHPEKMDFSNVRITRDPSSPYKYSYSADVNVSVPVDDNFKTEIRVAKWSAVANGWTNNVFRMTVPNPCSTFKANRPDIFKQVSDMCYEGTLTDCPLPPVTASVRDFIVEAKPPSNVRTLPYGRFKAKIKLIDQHQECISCYDAITDILPRRRQ